MGEVRFFLLNFGSLEIGGWGRGGELGVVGVGLGLGVLGCCVLF